MTLADRRLVEKDAERHSRFPEATTDEAGRFLAARGSFFWRGNRLIRLMADGGHYREDKHDERAMGMPAVPGSGGVLGFFYWGFACRIAVPLTRKSGPYV